MTNMKCKHKNKVSEFYTTTEIMDFDGTRIQKEVKYITTYCADCGLQLNVVRTRIR